MRILFLLDRLDIGGAEIHTMKLAADFAARGYEVDTVVLLAGGSSNFPVDGFPSPPQRLNGTGLTSWRMLRGLASWIRGTKPDVVFAVNQSTLVVATFLRLLGIRVSHLTCIFHTTVIASLAGRIRLKLFKWCTSRADALIFVSQMQRDYWQVRGMHAREVLAIPNGVDVRRFSLPLPAARAQLRERYGISETDFVLILVGRLAPEKNHAWLLEVFSAMRREALPEAQRIRLVFIGDGPLRDGLESKARALDVSRQVIFTGAHRDVAPLLAMGDVGLLVSHSIETFSLAALELMASGLPMIMTDTGGAAEILSEGPNDNDAGGILVPVGDSIALRNAILQVMVPGMGASLGKAARSRVEARFTVESMVARYTTFLAEATGIRE